LILHRLLQTGLEKKMMKWSIKGPQSESQMSMLMKWITKQMSNLQKTPPSKRERHNPKAINLLSVRQAMLRSVRSKQAKSLKSVIRALPKFSIP
jgi:hypothetical protein